nr:unnamed protein product [uncultured archaeal virus]
MDFLDIELETGHPVYEGVAFEEAELEEFGDIIRMVEVSYGYKRRELYRAINKLEKELIFLLKKHGVIKGEWSG